jgi:hypothetical protein
VGPADLRLSSRHALGLATVAFTIPYAAKNGLIALLLALKLLDKLTIDVQNRAAAPKAHPPRNAEPSEQPEGRTVRSGSGYFAIGSTKAEVRAAQGTPTGIEHYSVPGVYNHDIWHYGLDCSVDFSDGRVTGYSNDCDRLHVN